MSTAFAAEPTTKAALLPTSNWLDTDSGPVGEARISEAMFIASSLAGWGNAFGGFEPSEQCVNNILFSVLREHTYSEVVNWQLRVAQPERRTRWRWAAATTRRLYASLLDVRSVPLEFDDLPELTR